MVWKKLMRRLRGTSSPAPSPPAPRGAPPRRPRGVPVAPPVTAGALAAPRHLGDIWNILQDIAREESPEVFSHKQVSEHAAESVEGKKDVERWLEIYLNRTVDDHDYRFPRHHPRHRGFCLIPRHWPSGTLWEAFDDETLLRARIGPERSREALAAAIDRHLDPGPS